MKLAHVALWTTDLDRLVAFFEDMFAATASPLYESRRRIGFSSKFLTLSEGATIEIMSGPWIAPETPGERAGYAHMAISLGSRQAVDDMAAKAAAMGILVSPARMTGDGFYEAVISDPDGNPVEITD
ncbi:VOC family protein [Neorhizobium galegae]|uniref:VOC family protein n=1 Tax=Neorhizobium galegae TaxID=399 RepID=UPI000621F0B0|nr:VOC family protein [Neorhizobium galegae]CDZ34457.1 YyaH protein [Neorhizobium galegae bv. officinalis]KAA9383692.1 glyoxalase/bleomycin resistance/extradiol dioxygenase family protein [Neorhizobium galegae]KAB1111820.1 glyoxalase/bleomycin resistance/extradiol dioxygenase family protein [Neorhizobium galegae]MCM2500902.1 VOC family protein [Neorhizobium galegae]MCQ1768274.1 VOC family protein [Neorhizobium galegae]